MITIDIHAIFSVAACIVSFVALAAVYKLYKASEQWRERYLALEASMPSLRRDIELVASLNARTSRQLEKITHDHLGVQDRVDLVEQRGSSRAVGDAVEEARRGADVVKLTEEFGLSRGEAELVSRLHGQRRSA